jgi:hypothetical protein
LENNYLRNKSANLFIDNLGILYAIVNGVSKDLDLGTIIRGLRLRMTNLCASCWFEHIASWSNLFDGGSRKEGIADPLAASLGIKLRQEDMPQLPLAFPFVELDSWSSLWQTKE